MPEKQIETSSYTPPESVPTEFWDAFLTAAIWSSTNPETGEPLDADHTVDDIDGETLAHLATDCAEFLTGGGILALCETDLERAGIDFWLTRNGHGAGFWDGDWPEPAATILTNRAKLLGGIDLYVGDDGAIHAI